MALKYLPFRLMRYYRKNGLYKTIQRVWEKVIQGLFLNAGTLFYLDLTKLTSEAFSLPDGFEVEVIEGSEGLNAKDIKKLNDYVGRDEMEYEIERRFSKNAILWLGKQHGDLTAYLWSIRHTPIEPYYMPLGKDDVLLFDGAVLPEYRGRNIYPAFLTQVFQELKKRDMMRVVFDAYKWNKSVLRSNEKTAATKLHDARKINCLGRTIVIWNYNKNDTTLAIK